MTKYTAGYTNEYICKKLNINPLDVKKIDDDTFSIPLFKFFDNDGNKYSLIGVLHSEELLMNNEPDMKHVIKFDVYVSMSGLLTEYKYYEDIIYPVSKQNIDSYTNRLKRLMNAKIHKTKIIKYFSNLKKNKMIRPKKESKLENDYNLIISNTKKIRKFLEDNKEIIKYIIDDEEADPEFGITVNGLKASLFDLDRLIRNPEIHEKESGSVKNLFDYVHREYEKIKRIINKYKNNMTDGINKKALFRSASTATAWGGYYTTQYLRDKEKEEKEKKRKKSEEELSESIKKLNK